MRPSESSSNGVQALRLAGPPRPVSLLVRLQMLFGGWVNQFGWVVFGFGMVFFWLFACQADLTSWYRFRGHLDTAQGRVTDSSPTRATEGGSKRHPGTPIYQNACSFVVDDREYRCVSYAAGGELEVGNPVTVEYMASHPSVARIRGMRAAPFGPEALVVVLFPLLGLGFVSFGFSRGVRASYLLKHGMLTSARFVSKTPTNLQVGRQTVYSFTFAFTTDHGQACTASSKTLSALFENGGEELALYDPVQPQRVVILGALTYAPRIGEDGHPFTPQPAAALWCSVLPLAAILGHGWWFLWLLSH